MTTTTADWTPRENPSEDYERYLVPAQFGPFAADLVRLAAPWPGERILDVACGTGAVTRLLAEWVGPTGHVTGLDPSPAMLAVARSVLASPNVAWREASAVAMPWEDGAFDVVTCQQGIQYLPDREAGLREMRRVLRPGGRLIAAVWRSLEFNPVQRLLSEALARLAGLEAGQLPPFALGDADELRRLAREAGFAEAAVRIEGRVVRYPSASELVRWAVLATPSMLGLWAHLGPDANRRVAEEVTRTMAPYTDDAGLAVPLATHVLLAR